MPEANYSIETILSNLNIEALNEMQEAAIDAAAAHPNLILLSATGSGKTLAFLLPLIQIINKDVKQTQALIVVPSRELALQIETVFRSMGTGLKISCCYGGHKREIEENNLIQPPALIVGTPGRIADHMRRGSITVDAIKTLVLDEFDKTLELGFIEELSQIIGELKNIEKRILTSATQAVAIPEIVGVEGAFELNFLPEGPQSKEVLSVLKVNAPDKDKLQTLFDLGCTLGARPTIIFCNHREAVERTAAFLTEKSITAIFYHGAMEQREREVALAKFRNGSVHFLVTTDLASRGLDVPNIRYIIHYHLPQTEDIFTHRNGRTARMDASGTAIIMVGPDERLPPYIPAETEALNLSTVGLPDKPKWTTLFVGAGKKNKVNKVDIVGFLSNQAQLKKEDIGLIEVKDFYSFVAVRKHHVNTALQAIKDAKLKGKKIKIDVAK